jgi:hypothetical protein
MRGQRRVVGLGAGCELEKCGGTGNESGRGCLLAMGLLWQKERAGTQGAKGRARGPLNHSLQGLRHGRPESHY